MVVMSLSIIYLSAHTVSSPQQAAYLLIHSQQAHCLVTLHHHSLNASPSVASLQHQHGHLSWELPLIMLVKIPNKSLWSKRTSSHQLSENANGRCSSLLTPPPFPSTLTDFKQLSTQAYRCSFDEPPDHIFTFDNLYEAGCGTRLSAEIYYKLCETKK